MLEIRFPSIFFRSLHYSDIQTLTPRKLEAEMPPKRLVAGRQAGKCWQFSEAGRIAYILYRRFFLPTHTLWRQSCLPTSIFRGISAASSQEVK